MSCHSLYNTLSESSAGFVRALANLPDGIPTRFSGGPFHGSRLVLAGSKLGPGYAATVVTDTLLDHCVLYHNYIPADHGGNSRDAVASL